MLYTPSAMSTFVFSFCAATERAGIDVSQSVYQLSARARGLNRMGRAEDAGLSIGDDDEGSVSRRHFDLVGREGRGT